ncbi:phytoene desaturase, partial [Actinoallomurus acaciae]
AVTGNPASDRPLPVTRPTATDPALAPNGRQLLSAPIPGPAMSEGAGGHAASAYAEKLAALIATRCGLHGTAETLAALDQGLIPGTPTASACTYGRAEPSGPALARTSDNVVLSGRGTVPGLDVPMALLSGRQAADRVTGTPAPRPRLYAGRT